MATGMSLGYVWAAYAAMEFAHGKPFQGAELTHVVLASLDAVPHGVKSKTKTLPNHAAADCYNSAYAASLDVMSGPTWRYRKRQPRR